MSPKQTPSGTPSEAELAEQAEREEQERLELEAAERARIAADDWSGADRRSAELHPGAGDPQ